MMNGYSKIATTSTHKSRSIDFSEFFSFSAQTPRRRNNTTHLPPTPIRTTTLDQPPANHNYSPPQTQRQDEKGERFGIILGRSCSVSASSSSSSPASGFQATMKRAFSVRRSSSVTDRYCRIHDQSMSIAPDELDEDDHINIDDDDATKNKTNRRRGTRGKILKACKRMFGL
ncbi:hypothetical protein TSUD_391200 [Trifolium subterraneum]|uniref:Uncharacterized protein n=1 Tax=Trifolium subterraneum TaxID=3900 RepID=A0A2Z6LXU3_TRISU|nr:hypothetical protein TSUD_391200 [Trifolium subterraneum]